jgi:RNA polymerase sigma-70 factor, ECF subfamily
MTTTEPEDQVLIERFRDGDEAALRSLFERHEARMRGYLSPRLPLSMRRKVSVEDILQEAWLTAYRRISEFEAHHGGAFGAWLEQIVAFKLKEQIRRYRATAKRGAADEVTRGARPDTVLFAGSGPSPSEAAIGEELRVNAVKALDALPEDYRAVIQLVQLEQLTLRQAGEKMGRSREAMKKLYGRALNRLAELMTGDSGEVADG